MICWDLPVLEGKQQIQAVTLLHSCVVHRVCTREMLAWTGSTLLKLTDAWFATQVLSGQLLSVELSDCEICCLLPVLSSV